MENAAERASAPPREITLVYRPVGKSHVFTATGPKMKGFHISSGDLRRAFDLAGASLGRHVALAYGGAKVHYEIEHSFDDFLEHLQGREIAANVVRARLHETSARHAG